MKVLIVFILLYFTVSLTFGFSNDPDIARLVLKKEELNIPIDVTSFINLELKSLDQEKVHLQVRDHCIKDVKLCPFRFGSLVNWDTMFISSKSEFEISLELAKKIRSLCLENGDISVCYSLAESLYHGATASKSFAKRAYKKFSEGINIPLDQKIDESAILKCNKNVMACIQSMVAIISTFLDAKITNDPFINKLFSDLDNRNKLTNKELCSQNIQYYCIIQAYDERDQKTLKKICESNSHLNSSACEYYSELVPTYKRNSRDRCKYLSLFSEDGCLEAYKAELNTNLKNLFLYRYCSAVDSMDLRCKNKDNTGLYACLSGDNLNCLSYIRDSKSYTSNDLKELCNLKEDWVICNVFSAKLISEKKVEEGVSVLERSCNEDFNVRDACLNLASVQLIHGWRDASIRILKQMQDFGYFENFEEQIKVWDRIGKERYQSFIGKRLTKIKNNEKKSDQKNKVLQTIKQTKFLKIISNPKGALIYINGVSTSLKTPENIDIDQFKRKTISITLIKEGYYQYTTKATILGEYDQELYAELLRQQP